MQQSPQTVLTERICVHKYLKVCKTNPQPPGLGDFVRGTIALFNFAKIYNFKLLIDKDHPIFDFLENNDNLTTTDAHVIEALPPSSYETIYNQLALLFITGENFSIMTNSFYTIENRRLVNFGPISLDCRLFLQKIFTPKIEVRNKVESVIKNNYGLSQNEPFTLIHLRFGDKFLHDKSYLEEFGELELRVRYLIKFGSDRKFVLMSDSSRMAVNLKCRNPELCYWDNSKIHLGDLKNNDRDAVFETMVDFFIMSNAIEIISNGCSGFSKIVSEIFNIKYTCL
jgi:hypothetical protein